MSAVVREVLEDYGERTRVALCDYLAPRAPERHLYNLVADYPRRGGRMLRPSLAIATARAFGARIEEALHAAVALELLHNAFLVHDDVEDESTERRGRPTLCASHGAPIAVNVGDALVVAGLRALADSRRALGSRIAAIVLDEAERMTRESIEGQAIELGWRRDNATSVSEAAYLEMVLKKTCWYTTIFPSRVGALIGARDGRDLDRFVRFGFFLGAAFQIQDDLLNLEGDPEQYGKEQNGDLWEGKRTLLLISLLAAATTDERAALSAFLAKSRTERSADEVAWVRGRMDTYGTIDQARRAAHAMAGAARHEAEKLYGDLPESRDKRFIEELPTWVITRS